MTESLAPGSHRQNKIPVSIPEIKGSEWQYVKECLDTNWVSSAGKFVDRFEEAIARRVGRTEAVACVNGTAALHVSLLVAKVRPGEEVLVPALTFVAPVNTVRYVGAYPVFIDVDADTFQIDPRAVVDFLTKRCTWNQGMLVNTITGRKVVAIIPVHLLGHPVDMDPIMEIARHFRLTVIEDATESLGATYKGQSVGSLGDIACFSFNGNKIITTGGGGMIVTNNKEWSNKARYLTTQAKDDPVEFIHNEIGYNYRLTNIQAAIGVAQMERLEEHIQGKRAIAQRYQEGLHDVEGILLPKEASYAYSTYWLYTILVDQKKFGLSSRELMRVLNSAGIESRPLWHPIHSLLPFQECFADRIVNAEAFYQQALSLPCSVGLTASDQKKVISVIRDHKAIV